MNKPSWVGIGLIAELSVVMIGLAIGVIVALHYTAQFLGVAIAAEMTIVLGLIRVLCNYINMMLISFVGVLLILSTITSYAIIIL